MTQTRKTSLLLELVAKTAADPGDSTDPADFVELLVENYGDKAREMCEIYVKMIMEGNVPVVQCLANAIVVYANSTND